MIDQEPAPDLLRIELAGKGDLAEVMRIMDSAFEPRFGEAWTALQCAGILPMPGVMLKLARSQDGVGAGFALFRTVADESELLLLAVHPEQRRRGVGSRLLQDVIASVREAGASKVHLEVRENNPAVHLYRAAAFDAVGRRRNYYSGSDGSLFDAITFARSV
jgi:[ribosomal protein S18]-alanine N-acetyltransferase